MTIKYNTGTITWFDVNKEMPEWKNGNGTPYEILTYHHNGGVEICEFYPYDNFFSRGAVSHWAYINEPVK